MGFKCNLFQCLRLPNTFEAMTWSNSALTLYIPTTVLAQALLNTHWNKLKKHPRPTGTKKPQYWQQNLAAGPEMRTISLLSDNTGHKLLSTEAYGRTFAFQEPQRT